MSQREPSIQTVYLDRVRGRLPENVSFADELAEILNISRDSAYRRIRAETLLSLEEIKVLYNRFGISLDDLLSANTQMVTFHRRVVNPDNYDIEKWQNSVLKNLDHLSSFEEKQLIFSAKDIPVFHYFRRRDLSSFKHFFWMKTLFGYPGFEKKKYRPGVVPESLLHAAEKVFEKYSSLPSTEIWNEEVIFDILKQVQFYHECNFFDNPKEGHHLCDEILLVLADVEAEACSGFKSSGGLFKLFKNDILIADNTVLAKMGKTRSVYINQNALNLLLTFQEPFCQQTEAYLDNLIAKSTLISNTSEKERTRFFNIMRSQVENVRRELR